jgi:hypothetical protein
VALPTTYGVLGGIDIPDGGPYLIMGKLLLRSATGAAADVRCSLVAGQAGGSFQNSFDENATHVSPGSSQTMAFQLGVQSAANTNFQCVSSNAGIVAEQMRLTAIHVGSLTTSGL